MTLLKVLNLALACGKLSINPLADSNRLWLTAIKDDNLRITRDGLDGCVNKTLTA